MIPELRIIACERARDLPAAIGNELRTWGEFEKVEVFDSEDRPMFSLTPGLLPAH
jgi:hypothetical protein